ncbi:MAG: DUF177 domain-containing protein [Deltaproteobacteria bacterium]|nr:DUF177 domain-containing protein [Deltaproteobacteria bacterium]MBW2015948.1 DUF177 domain-containing protein [Deltaproteobacteria bacterium]MBW2129354.1 DUF177 domain-containing protein [Deltaproteobacteria bacterium]MBW2302319.1 DUF177 domain-containing protein [Deltaproteobacteria bacterium]
MIIDLRRISQESKTFTFVLKEGWWEPKDPSDQILSLDGPLKVVVTLYSAGDKYVMDGRLRGGLKVRCDRCLESHHRDIQTEFQTYLALPPPGSQEESDVELTEEDMDVDFIRGEEIDLTGIIREQIYLSLPMKVLCSAECKGLCPRCGKNLNEEICCCLRETGHPAFLKLNQLKIQP